MKVLISSVVAAAGLIFFLAGPAAAQKSAEEAVDAALACRSIEDNAARLDCLDKAAEDLAATRIVRDAEDAETPELNPEEIFGFGGKSADKDEKSKKEKRKKPRIVETPEDFGGETLPARMKERDEARLKEITATAVEIRLNPFGKATLTLDNGHIWRQLDSDDRSIWLDDDKLYTVTVKRAIMGNYTLRVNEIGRTIRVRRIQ